MMLHPENCQFRGPDSEGDVSEQFCITLREKRAATPFRLPSLVCTAFLAPTPTGVAGPVPTAIVAVSADGSSIALNVAVSFAHLLALALCRTIVAFSFKLPKFPTIVFEFALVAPDVAIDSAAVTTTTIVIVAAVITASPIPVMVMATVIGASPVAAAMRSPVMVLRHHRAGTGQC